MEGNGEQDHGVGQGHHRVTLRWNVGDLTVAEQTLLVGPAQPHLAADDVQRRCGWGLVLGELCTGGEGDDRRPPAMSPNSVRYIRGRRPPCGVRRPACSSSS